MGGKQQAKKALVKPILHYFKGPEIGELRKDRMRRSEPGSPSPAVSPLRAGCV